MFDLAFLDVMTSRPSLLPAGTGAQYGRRVYGAPVVMAAYWVQGGEVAESSGGESSNTSGTLYVAPPAYWPVPFDRLPNTDDGLLLPDGTRPTVSKVTAYRDADGTVYGLEVAYS